MVSFDNEMKYDLFDLVEDFWVKGGVVFFVIYDWDFVCYYGICYLYLEVG